MNVSLTRMILQSPAPTPWPSPIGPTPYEVFERYFNDGVYKTWGNISPLYQLDTFDYVILIVYFSILGNAGRLRRLSHQAGRRLLALSQASSRGPAPDSPKPSCRALPFSFHSSTSSTSSIACSKPLPQSTTHAKSSRSRCSTTRLTKPCRVAEAVVAKYAAQGF